MQPLIYCNWKTYILSENDAVALATILKQINDVTIAVFPSALHISSVGRLLADSSVILGAQDISRNSSKPHTGRVSGEQLTAIGVTHALVGHIETRNNGVTDAMVVEKVRHAHETGITPVLCVNDSDGHDVVKQVTDALHGTSAPSVIAYEPADRVGADAALDPATIHTVSDAIRGALSDSAPDTPILYGGAVDEATARSIIEEGGVDGLLIGRASVHKESIKNICASIC